MAIAVVLVGCGVSPDAEDVATMDAAVAQVHEFAEAAGGTVIDSQRGTSDAGPLAMFPQKTGYVARIGIDSANPDSVRAELASQLEEAPLPEGIRHSVFVSGGDVRVTLELSLRS